VVPACRSFDTITAFAATLELARRAVEVMSGPDAGDGRSRSYPADAAWAAGASPVIAVPTAPGLAPVSPAGRRAFGSVVARLADLGCVIEEVDVAPLLEAALLLYDGALVAERYAAVGEFLETRPAGADPSVSAIITAAAGIPAHRYVADTERLDRAKTSAAALLDGRDALLLPTVPTHPTLAEVAADPIGVNRFLGTYTNFVNLLDLSAVAVPGGVADGGPFGVSLIGPAFADRALADLAGRLLGTPQADGVGVDLAVFGAHLSGQPLNHQLSDRGARLLGPIVTSPRYRLFALATVPPKPGLVPVADGGSAVAGQLWRLSPAALGSFLAELPAPMTLGSVELSDGRRVVGFSCTPDAVASAADITRYGGWLAYLADVA
jgi:allophanate hydrolase